MERQTPISSSSLSGFNCVQKKELHRQARGASFALQPKVTWREGRHS